MKIRSAEFLAAVAIISSATVMQIREHIQPHEGPTASAHSGVTLCGATRRGVVPAACETTRGEGRKQIERAQQPQRGDTQAWV